MKVSRLLMIVAIAAGGLSGGPTNASNPTREGSATTTKVHTRVFYLQGMDARQAITLLRSQAQVRQVASISDRDVIVVAGITDTVERCEALLREHAALLRVADPYGPVELGEPAGVPLVTHVFRVAGGSTQAVVVVLRSIYQVRELSETAQDNTVSVRVTQPVLDSSEALLRELELLDVPTEVPNGFPPAAVDWVGRE